MLVPKGSEADQTSKVEQPEILQIQDDIALTEQQIRKIFEGYIGGACGLANIFCNSDNDE